MRATRAGAGQRGLTLARPGGPVRPCPAVCGPARPKSPAQRFGVGARPGSALTTRNVVPAAGPGTVDSDGTRKVWGVPVIIDGVGD